MAVKIPRTDDFMARVKALARIHHALHAAGIPSSLENDHKSGELYITSDGYTVVIRTADLEK